MVTDLDFTFEEDTPFSLLCYSHNSPPTTVFWSKDNEKISLEGSDGYQMTQVVVDRGTSAYVSTLTMNGVLAYSPTTFWRMWWESTPAVLQTVLGHPILLMLLLNVRLINLYYRVL